MHVAIRLLLAAGLTVAGLLTTQLGSQANAQAQIGGARVTFLNSECPAAQLQVIDTGQIRPSVDRWRMLEIYLVIDDTRTGDGFGLVNGDVVLLELDNGLSPVYSKPITLIWTGQFIGVPTLVADTRPTAVVCENNGCWLIHDLGSRSGSESTLSGSHDGATVRRWCMSSLWVRPSRGTALYNLNCETG